MALRPIRRTRATGLDEKAGTFDDGSRVWIWNVDTGGRDVDGDDLRRLFDDFTPGFTQGKYYVDGVDLQEIVPGAEFIQVVQSWRRIETENPLNVPFKWVGMESIDLEIPTTVDLDGKPVVTTAGEPIIGMTRNQKVWRFSGEKNIAGIPAWLALYGRSTNSDTIRIGTVAIPPGQLQLQKVRIGPEDDSTQVAGRKIIFRKLEIEFWWNTAGWMTELLNMGFYELQDVSPVRLNADGTPAPRKPKYRLVRISNTGSQADRPFFLNKKGQRPRDKEGNVLTEIPPSEVVVLHFNFNERLPYSRLLR